MAAHSSVLAWRIPGTAEPGGLPSMGSYRVRHNWSDLAAAVASTNSEFYFFPCLISVARTSSTVLNRSGKSGHPCLVPGFRGKAQSFSPLNMILAVSLSCCCCCFVSKSRPVLCDLMDRGAWWAAVHGVANSQTWLSDFTFTFHLHALEKEMATHSSVLAWRIPGTEEPGRLQSMGSLRVGHDWATLLSLFTLMPWRRKWQPTPVFLPGESQGRGSLVGCLLWGRTKSDMTEAT